MTAQPITPVETAPAGTVPAPEPHQETRIEWCGRIQVHRPVTPRKAP